jgi:hypothetical protein
MELPWHKSCQSTLSLEGKAYRWHYEKSILHIKCSFHANILVNMAITQEKKLCFAGIVCSECDITGEKKNT